jgi:hypothetical protein
MINGSIDDYFAIKSGSFKKQSPLFMKIINLIAVSKVGIG